MPEYSLEDLQAELSNRETSTDTRQQQALDYFQGQGWQPHQAAGIVGNLFHESGLKTSALGDKGASLGIAQWGGPRRKALHEYATQKGTSPYDFNTQLEFINYELNTGEGAAGDALRRARDTAQATQIFSRHYERPGKPMMGSRLAAARRLEKRMDVTGAGVRGEPTLEELEAELARREGAAAPAEPTLTELEAELNRRTQGTAEAVGGAMVKPMAGAIAKAQAVPEPPPKVETHSVLERFKEPLAAETAFEPPVFPQRQVPTPTPAPVPPLRDPRLVPGATEHLTGRISPEPTTPSYEKETVVPLATPQINLPKEALEWQRQQGEAEWRRAGLAQPPGMPPLSKVELLNKEGELVPPLGVGDPFQPADIPAIILSGGLTAAPKVGIPLALKAMTKSIAPVVISVAAMEAATGMMENQPFYQQFPLSLAAGVLAGVVTHRLGRMASPTVLRQTIGGGKPIQVSPELFKGEISQRVLAGMDYKTALHDVAQKYGSTIDEILSTAGSLEFRQQIAKGAGTAAGAEAAETLKRMTPTTGKEDVFVGETKEIVDTAPQTRPEKITEHEAIAGQTKVNDLTYAKFVDLLQTGEMDKARTELATITANFSKNAFDHHFNPLNIMGRLVDAGVDRQAAKEIVKTYEREVFKPVRGALEGKPTTPPTPPVTVSKPRGEAIAPEARVEVTPETMTPGTINKELDKLDAQISKLNSQLIDAGRGTEKLSEVVTKTDPLSVAMKDNLDRARALRDEIAARYGPGAPSRLPLKKGFGPRVKEEPVTVRAVGEVYQDPSGKYRIEGSENIFDRKVEADKAAATIKKYQDVFAQEESGKYLGPVLDEEGFIDMAFLRSPAQYIKDVLNQTRSGLGPGAISPEHLKAAEVAGSHLGALHRRGESAAVQLKPGRRFFDRMGVTDPSITLEKNEGIRFMSAMTKPGQPVASEFQGIKDKISELFGQRLAELRRVGKPLNDVRANYFPGMWTRESRLAFNQAMDEAIWTEGRGLDPTGRMGADVLPVDLWTNADKAWVKARVEELLAQGGGTDKKDMLGYISRRPLAGRETFRKPKVFDDIMTGIEFGLKPISNNPVDLALLKMAEMDRSIWAHGVIKELKDAGDVRFVRTTQKPPPGFVDLDAGRPYAEVYGAYDPATGARPLYGRWVAKAPAAQIIDNYLSQSLYNSPTMGKAYQSLMFGANLLNQWQLMSFFHAGFTTFETQISAGAQILKDVYGVLRGNRSLGDLGNTIKEFPKASTKFVREGNRALSEWVNPSINVPDNVPIRQLAPNTPEAAIVAKAAEIAGGGFGMERRWQTHWLDKFIKEVHGGQKVKGALRSPVVFSEMMMKPVLEWLVPRQKAAVFGDMVGRLLEQNPGKTLQELRGPLRQAWNRVDSRLGQVRYDRLFMKESTKNWLQALVRAPGWTGGTIAEIGGSPLDAGRWIKEWAQTGKIPADMPDRVAYTMSLLGTMTIANGITTLVYDRLADKPFLKGDNLWAKVKNMDPMDWFAFRTGDKHPDGREVRYLYPTYMKDLFAWYEAPAHTAFSKTHPIWGMLYDLKQNKNYYSEMIANPRDPWYSPRRAMDMGKYVLKSFIPFGVKGMMNVTGESDFFKAIQQLPTEIREEPGKVIAPQFGIMPAPRAMTATPFMKAMDEAFSKAGKPTLTPKEAEALREKSRVRVLYHKGKIDEAEAKMDELREKGELTKQKEKNLRRKMSEPQTYLFKQVKNIDDAIYAWDKASDTEKSYIAAEMEKKLRNLQKKNKAKYAEIEGEAERIWGELDNIERQSEAEKNVRKGRWSVEMGAEYIGRGATKQ